jgi:hypothetical protein
MIHYPAGIDYKMKKAWLLMVCIALAGCVNKPQSAPKSLVTPAQAPAPVTQQAQVVTNDNTIKSGALTANETCVKSLRALQTYSPKSWNKYSVAMDELNSKNSLFLSVKNDLNPQLNDLVINAYVSKMKTLCYRIESTLGQAMIAQVDPL